MNRFHDLLAALRHGDDVAGELLEQFRPWLRRLAREQFDTKFADKFAGKFDASDIVQQAMLEAYRDAPQFRGGTREEFAAWLRQIVSHVAAHEIRRYHGAAKRDISRERSLEDSSPDSTPGKKHLLAAALTSPSQKALRKEEAQQLEEVLARLPEDYQEVINLRNLQGLSHEQIAQRMNRSVGAVRMLWVRALARLRQELE